MKRLLSICYTRLLHENGLIFLWRSVCKITAGKYTHFSVVMCIYILIIFLSLCLPVTVKADSSLQEPPIKPYDRIIAKSGSWYVEQVKYKLGAKLVFAYTGSYAPTDTAYYEFRIDEPMFLNGICIPFSDEVSKELSIR
ncbi:MAG TPA: hypothetical protein DDZ89_10685, partial [Clostridiales bacterium]|nr:hypothetical protein [Clostridiales bacterium]